MVLSSTKFNPAFLGEEELIAGFVARAYELGRIVEIVRDNSGAANQHVLILGPRGYGKTTLILRIAAEVRANETLQRDWYPIVFSEEVEVSTAGELWAEAVFFLAKQTENSALEMTYRRLREEPQESKLRELALTELRAFSKREKKRLIIAVENLQVIFTEQLSSDDAWTFRHALQNESAIMLVTTSTVRFHTIVDPTQALYELFHVIELDPLNGEECARLFTHLSSEEVDSLRGRALQILTGGNPRLLVVLSRFAAGVSLASLIDDFARLLDDNSDYFKGNIDSLPPIERKVFTALAELWVPASVQEVAKFARVGLSVAQDVLGRLTRRGVVLAQTGHATESRYQVSERLYNIYWILRRHGRDSDRVRFVVDFISAYYDVESLAKTCLEFANEALSRERHDRGVYVHSFYQLVARLPADNRAKVLLGLSRDFFALPGPLNDEARLLSDEHERLQSTPPEESPSADPAALVRWLREAVDQQPFLLALEEVFYQDCDVRSRWKTFVDLFKNGVVEGNLDDVMKGVVEAVLLHFDGARNRIGCLVRTAHRGRDLSLVEVVVAGGLALALGDDITPLRLVRIVVRRYPTSPWPHVARIVLRFILGYDEAEKSIVKAQKVCLKFQRLGVCLVLGLLFELGGEREGARVIVQRGVPPELPLRLTDAVLGIRGDILSSEYELLLDPRWRPLVKLLDDELWSDVVALLHGFAAALFGDARQCFEILSRGAAALPNSFEIHVRLSLAAMAVGERRSASAALARAVELRSGMPALQLALGVQLALRQRNDDAREAILRSWRSFCEANPTERGGERAQVHRWLSDASHSVSELPVLGVLERVSGAGGDAVVKELLEGLLRGADHTPFEYVLVACICLLAGRGDDLEVVLRESRAASRVEPLRLALARLGGSNAPAPQEVSEIADDIVATIELVTDIASEIEADISTRPGMNGA